MRFLNTETPTNAATARSDGSPSVTETYTLVDRDGVALFTLTKNADGTLTHDLPLPNALTATASEINQHTDVSAYQEIVVATGALSVTKHYSDLSLVGAGAVTLAAPSATMLGQIKVIEMITDNGDVTLALTNVVGQSSGTTATFNDAGDQLVLIAAAAKWIVLKERGIALA